MYEQSNVRVEPASLLHLRLLKTPDGELTMNLVLLSSLRDLSLKKPFPLLHPAFPESFPFSSNQEAAALPGRCLQRLCNVYLASDWQKTVTTVEVLECLSLCSVGEAAFAKCPAVPG